MRNLAELEQFRFFFPHNFLVPKFCSFEMGEIIHHLCNFNWTADVFSMRSEAKRRGLGKPLGPDVPAVFRRQPHCTSIITLEITVRNI